MKENIKTFLLAGGLFGVIMGLFMNFISGSLLGIIAGVVLGCIFGIFTSAFLFNQRSRFEKNRSKIIGSNGIILEGAANHFKGTESVGGWLYLTTEEIIFKSHNINVQTHKTVIPLNSIIGAQISLTLGFVPNGLHIKTNDGVEKFVVNKNKIWLKEINDAILSTRTE